jgi:hypothetical protein
LVRPAGFEGRLRNANCEFKKSSGQNQLATRQKALRQLFVVRGPLQRKQRAWGMEHGVKNKKGTGFSQSTNWLASMKLTANG